MRLLIWLLFGVCSAVLPLVLAAIVMFDHDKFERLSDTWGHGELLLIAMTLLLASLGDLIVYESVYPKVKTLITVISFFLIIVSAVWYMDIFGVLLSGGKAPKEEFLRKWSTWFFGFCLINATVCIMLPKKETAT
jgi:cell division protein FtsW (lipid II flippase)